MSDLIKNQDDFLNHLILEQVAGCLNDLNLFWLFTDAMEVVDHSLVELKVVSEEPEKLAAGLILNISRHFDMDNAEALFPLTTQAVMDHFDMDRDDLEKITEKVGNVVAQGSTSFAGPNFDHVLEEFYDDNSLDSTWVIQKHAFQYHRELRPKLLNQLIRYIDAFVDMASSDMETEDKLILMNTSIDHEVLEVEVEGYFWQVNLLIELVESLGLFWLDMQPIDFPENQYIPSDHYLMIMEHYEFMNFDHLGEMDPEDLNDAIEEKFIDKTLDEIRAESELSVEAEARVEALQCYRRSKEPSIAKLKNILLRSPQCVEAHLCLAGWEDEHEQRVMHLENAISAGEETINIDEVDERGTWWIEHTTRPYMRALSFLAMELFQNDKKEEALEIILDLLDMDPYDHMGLRYFLLEYYIDHRKWLETRNLLRSFPEDDSLTFAYGKVIYLYYSLGRKSKTKKTLIKAYHRNPYPLHILAGVEPVPEVLTHYTPGSPEEGMQVIDLLASCVTRDEKLGDWMIQTLMESNVWDDRDSEFPGSSGEDWLSKIGPVRDN